MKKILSIWGLMLLMLPLSLFADAQRAHFIPLSELTVAEYVKLASSDNPHDIERAKSIIHDSKTLLIEADSFARLTQKVPLFCSDNKGDEVNIDAESLADILSANLNRLNIHQQGDLIRSTLPFTYYLFGVMENAFPCSHAKGHIALFQMLEDSYLKAQNELKSALVE
ncbi:hypothetical protein [Fangia hongkongensis]|nr:hypothetical protein [Fangia hongkongensis]MBK2126097.1 hypothetical protein [Fangia hongkongensis]